MPALACTVEVEMVNRQGQHGLGCAELGAFIRRAQAGAETVNDLANNGGAEERPAQTETGFHDRPRDWDGGNGRCVEK
jgi:hypothetical protein